MLYSESEKTKLSKRHDFCRKKLSRYKNKMIQNVCLHIQIDPYGTFTRDPYNPTQSQLIRLLFYIIQAVSTIQNFPELAKYISRSSRLLLKYPNKFSKFQDIFYINGTFPVHPDIFENPKTFQFILTLFSNPSGHFAYSRDILYSKCTFYCKTFQICNAFQ